MIDDDIFEEDEYFYVHLSNPRLVAYPEVGAAPPDAGVTPKAVLGDNHTATVTIYDDDHAGEMENSHPETHTQCVYVAAAAFAPFLLPGNLNRSGCAARQDAGNEITYDITAL